MGRTLLAISLLFFLFVVAGAQEIKVTPSSANVYSQGPTTVFLTYGGVKDRRPVEACWCGELMAAGPDVGQKCNPATIFGCAPVRYNQSTLSGTNAYTDVMSIPASVVRRAYLDAAAGAEGTFFYVRRFLSVAGGPDEFVPVTLRLSGAGAAAPFSLTDVKLSWGNNKPALFVKAGEKLPSIKAEISYTGTGRLKGRWEIVKPGEELPVDRDLLSEAALPIEERGMQRRYSELSRFNVYLPPTGRFVLQGPETWRVPSDIDGLYVVLFRIEAADDPRGGLNLAEVGAGTETVSTGAVAGFQLPTLRYYVQGEGGQIADQTSGKLALLAPLENARPSAGAILDFKWSELQGALFYRLEIEDPEGGLILAAILPQGAGTYHSPPWLRDKTRSGGLRWRIVALDQAGARIGETEWRSLQFAKM